MRRITYLTFSLAVTFFLLPMCAQAQTPRMATVNVTPDADKVHISAIGEVSEIRVDVADEQGEVVFQSGAITGQTLDWKMTDAQGERVAPGTYLVTVTFRTTAGKLRKRVEQVVVAEDEKVRTEATIASAPNAVQATITGAGSTGRIAKFTGFTSIGNSSIVESSSKIGIGTSAPNSLLTVISADANNPSITGRNNATNGVGVFGLAPNGFGVVGQSSSKRGVVGTSVSGDGVVGTSSSGNAVLGDSSSGIGVNGVSVSSTGVRGFSERSFGVAGQSVRSTGVLGLAQTTTGVGGQSTSGIGVRGASTSNVGVAGDSTSGIGVRGQSSSGVGVRGISVQNDGVVGQSSENAHSGVVGSHKGSGIGVFGESLGGGFAGFFAGKVRVTGTLTKGGGSFQIDHPLDPANKYLSHSFVESPDMMNIYNGIVTLDRRGQARVQMPSYFSALNRDFRYQLTAIGRPGPRLYIAEKIANNRFKIAGGRAGMEVSWMVTGIRHDAFADAHRIPVEEDKPEKERGTYLHPEVFGQPADKGVEQARRAPQTQQQTAEAARAQTTGQN